ncbi:MAG: hypothetical protein EOP00_34060 [Pedobacter sp.]|nr:MAG: hypothetical protein EOP00_34060 [Pedobacter sp.]
MYNVTLVFTHHSEIGICNSEELYKIIVSIAPDVIFEELPDDLFIRFYPENQLPYEPPEVKTVRRYIRTHNIDHIPVDNEVNQSLFNEEIYHIFGLFKKFTVHKILEGELYTQIIEDGYTFLNSQKCEQLHMRKKNAEQSLLQFMSDRDRLSRIYKSFYEEQDVREHAIIKNIYNYSKQKPYNQGLLLIGSGHRKTILEKIQTYKTQYDLKLNWTPYGA